MDQVVEFKTEMYSHSHSFSLRALTWATLAITAVMGVLFFAVGFPPAFDTFYEKMYFHAIGIGIAALAVYLILETFRLEDYEPPLDFPIRYRAILAVAFGAIGGLIALSPSVWQSLPQVGMVFFTISFVLIFDVGAALLVELFVLPRKRAGTYTGASRSAIDYVWRIVPLTAADRAAYRGVGAGYWLTIGSLVSACVAMAIGFVNLWVRAFGPSIFGAWYAGLGLDRGGILDATLDPHSHMLAIAIVAMAVGVAVIRFGALDGESQLRRTIAGAGTWVTLAGVVLTTLVLGAVAFFNYAPPTLFTSGPDGVNGVAGDDLIMTIVFVGAIVVAAAVVGDRRSRRDGLRMTILGTWAAAVAITVVEGIYIELNQDQFGGALSANDAAFSSAHPMTGIFLMLVLSLALLVVDVFGVPARLRRIEIAIGATGLVAAFAGTTLWTFADPSNTGPSYALYVAGIGLSYVAVLGAGLVLRSVRPQGSSPTPA